MEGFEWQIIVVAGPLEFEKVVEEADQPDNDHTLEEFVVVEVVVE